MELLHFDQLPAVPWKNGGGITRELASRPRGAGLDDFTWRVSIADIAASGPFSHFPGVERSIMLLDGDGMVLDFGDRQHALTTPLQPFRFHGEAAVHAQLCGGRSSDFNLMLRRELVDGEIAIWRTDAHVSDSDGFVLFYCAAGTWDIGGQRLHARDTLLGTVPAAGLQLQPLQADAALVGVRIVPLASTSGEDAHGQE